MASYDQSPGALNFSLKSGDDFSALVDFSPITMSGYTVSASISSLVNGSNVVSFETQIVSEADGKVNLSLSDSQTSALPRGTYGWSLRWIEGEGTRTALNGFVEVT